MKEFLNSTIGKKFLMACSGVVLILFLFVHLFGNIYLFYGDEKFNIYAHNLHALGPVLHLAETLLFFILVIHIYTGIAIARYNRKARPINYYKKESLKESTFSSRSMAYTGSLILLFIIIHIITFKMADKELVSYDSVADVEDVYSVVVNSFGNPYYSIMYIFFMIVLAIHLRHAFHSAMKTLGILNDKWMKIAEKISTVVAIFLGVSFSLFPLYFMIYNL